MTEFFSNELDNAELVDYGPVLDVGPQTGGTYDIPVTAQPNNRPWDAPGGQRGDYSADVLGILRDGVGIWAQKQRNDQFLDYQRYEATNGGVYRQGRSTPIQTATGTVTVRSNNNMMYLLIGVGLILLLRK